MKSQKVTFENEFGHTLSGSLDMPDGKPRAYALFAHCFTCGKNLTAVRRISQQLTSEGIALLRFDFTGLGESEGEFAATSFTTNMLDLHSAGMFLAEQFEAPKAIIGHSLGGAAALAVVGEMPSVRCIATIGAPAEPTHIRHLLESAEFGEDDRATITIAGRSFQLGRQFLEDLEQHDLADRAARLNRPLLVFHSPVDTVVGIENAEKIFRAAKHPRSFISLGAADHLVSDQRDAEFLGHVLSAWASRYMEA